MYLINKKKQQKHFNIFKCFTCIVMICSTAWFSVVFIWHCFKSPLKLKSEYNSFVILLITMLKENVVNKVIYIQKLLYSYNPHHLNMS